MTRILVTGASGMLGRVLVPTLKGAGFEVLAHGTKAGDVVCDMRDEAATLDALKRADPEIIVNLVALTNVDTCEQDNESARALNVGVVETLARWLRPRTGRHLIHISTDQVYEGAGPHTEGVTTIVNYYAQSKFAGEEVARSVPATIIRTNFFGTSQVVGRPSFSDWIIQKFREGQHFNGFRDVLFNPLRMTTLAKILVKVAAGPKEGTFNVGAGSSLSKADFAALIGTYLGADLDLMTPCSVEDAHLKAPRPRDMRMNTAAFTAAYGIVLPALVEEIAAEVVALLAAEAKQ